MSSTAETTPEESLSGPSRPERAGAAAASGAPTVEAPVEPAARPEPHEPPPAAGPEPEVATSEGAAADLPVRVLKECEESLAELKGIRQGIPLSFGDLGGRHSQISADILKAVGLAQRFLTACGEHEEAPWVEAYLARDLFSRNRRWFSELPKDLTSQQKAEEKVRYFARLTGYGERALARSAPGSEARLAALATLADAALHEGEFERQRRFLKMSLEEFPDSRYRQKFLGDYAYSLVRDERYSEAVRYIEGVIGEYAADDNLVLYHSRLMEAYRGAGELEAMEELCLRMRQQYPERQGSVSSAFLKSGYVRWVYESGFWIGFSRYALGDVQGAYDGFTEAVERIGSAKAEGVELPNVVNIIKTFRVDKHLAVLEHFQGKVPEVDFASGIDWVTDEKPTLKGSRGKVVALVFRLPRDRRAHGFLQEIADLAHEHKDLVGITLGFYSSGLTEERRLQRRQAMIDDLAELEVKLPAGFDETPGQQIFRKLHATVGTPSFAVIDRKGNYAWYLQSPGNIDRAVARRVIERLLAEE